MPWTSRNTLEETLVPSAARTANGSIESPENYAPLNRLRAQLEVTAAAGTTPTLNVVIETTVDGTNWDAIITFPQATAASRNVQQVVDVVGKRIRARWTVGGTTPSFTFSVKLIGEGVA